MAAATKVADATRLKPFKTGIDALRMMSPFPIIELPPRHEAGIELSLQAATLIAGFCDRLCVAL
jgi:hypothetical protein